VRDRGEGRTEIEWVIDLLPHDAASQVKQLAAVGATAMKETLEGAR
jgi:hypothetical protein